MNSILDLRNEQRWDDCLQKVEAMKKTESEEGVYLMRAKEHSCHCHSKVRNVYNRKCPGLQQFHTRNYPGRQEIVRGQLDFQSQVVQKVIFKFSDFLISLLIFPSIRDQGTLFLWEGNMNLAAWLSVGQRAFWGICQALCPYTVLFEYFVKTGHSGNSCCVQSLFLVTLIVMPFFSFLAGWPLSRCLRYMYRSYWKITQ